MYTRPTAPRTIGGVLDDAVNLYRRSFPSIWRLTLVASLLPAVLGMLLPRTLEATVAPGPGGLLQMLAVMSKPSYWLTTMAVAMWYAVFYGAVLYALDRFSGDDPASFGDALTRGLRLMPRMIVVFILLGLMICVGTMLFVVPGIYLWGIFQLAVVALVVEDAGISRSFGISRYLIRGHWWRSGTIVSVGAMIMVVFSVIAGILSGVSSVALGFTSVPVMLVQTVINAAINIFMFPLLPCFLLCTYYDLRLRHESAELAARVDALAAQ